MESVPIIIISLSPALSKDGSVLLDSAGLLIYNDITSSAAPEMSQLDKIKRTQILSVFEGSIYNGFFLITQGFLGTGLALEFGASEPVIALLGVLPTISQFVQLLAPAMMRLIGNRKRAMMIFATISRLSTAFIPVTLAVGMNRQSILLMIMAFFSMAASLTGNFWVSLMKDVAPREKAAKFFSSRNIIFTITNMLITLFYSFVLDAVPGTRGFFIISVLGTISALFSLVLLGFHYDPPREITYGRGLFRAVTKDRKFMPYLVFYAFWSFSIAITSPFFSYHELVNMKLGYSFLSILNVFSSLLTMVFYFIWGKIADRIGSQAVLEFGVFGAFIKIILWVFMNEQTVYLLYVDTLIGTISWSAINLCLFTTMLDLLDGVNTESYYALLSFANGGAALVGSLAGGFLASYLNRFGWEILGMRFYGIQILFFVTFVLRGLSLFLLRRVKTRKERSVAGMIFNSAAVIANRLAARPREMVDILVQLNRKRKKGRSDVDEKDD